MAIIQISKIQHRTGNLVDLPQLDEGEFGWANDEKRLFIGKITPNENVEVLTSYSNINFDQINGAVGNLFISDAVDGQVLAYDGNNWVNRGGSAGGVVDLGDVGNLKISGGAISFVLETDGLGNLSWTPKSTVIAFISDVTSDDPAVVTTTEDNFLTNGLRITVTEVQGMTELNGSSYFVKVLTSSTFELYTDPSLTIPLDTTGFGAYTSGGRVVASISGGGGGSIPGGVNTNIQFNDAGGLGGVSGFSFNKDTSVLTLTGNANVGNLNSSGIIVANRLVSTAPNGIAPLQVNSTTVVANLNVERATVSDFGVVTASSTGTFFPVFVNNSATGNRSLSANDNISFNAATGQLSVTSLAGNLTTNAQPNITSVGELTSLAVSGNITAANITANTGVFTGNGSGLSSIAGANVTGTVASATTAGTVTENAQPNITSVGTLTSLQISETNTLTVRTISTGANTTTGTIIGNWALTSGSRIQATYADLAEYYEADSEYEPGTVLMFGGDKEVTLAEDGTNKVAGVVSTNPAYVMNSTCPGLSTAIALQGRVPCKVRGKIKKGDMLIAGGHGFAKPNQFPAIGTVVGKALQDFDGYEGVIEVAVGRL